MSYFYHAVPEKMEGAKLLPLSSIKKQNQDLGNEYSKKYLGREEVAKQEIPLLSCNWSDVIQMIPLEPQKVFDAQREMGIKKPALPKKYYKIPATMLDPAKTGVFFKAAPGEKHKYYKLLNDVDLSTIQEVPPSTLVYFKMCAEFNHTPFNFQFIPRVFYKGEIDISNIEIIEAN